MTTMNKYHAQLITFMLVTSLSACAVTASKPDYAMIKASQVNIADLKNKSNFRSRVIYIKNKAGKVLTVSHGLLSSNFVEVPPGEYEITFACTPFGVISESEIKAYVNTYKGTPRVQTKHFVLSAGEKIRTAHENGNGGVGCGLRMITCTGMCSE